MSDTPRMDDIWGRHVGDDFGFEDHSGHLYLEGQNLERELAEVKEQLWLCNVDQFTTAAELEYAKKDAGRYRWLRKGGIDHLLHGRLEELDAAIDEAMKEV